MSDYTYLGIAIAPFVGLPLAVGAVLIGFYPVASFLTALSLVLLIGGSSIRALNDIRRHGIHNDR